VRSHGHRRDQEGGDNELEQAEVKQILLDPKIFNYVIMVLYFLNAVRWLIDGKIADVCYWLSALAITATVTFLYNH